MGQNDVPAQNTHGDLSPANEVPVQTSLPHHRVRPAAEKDDELRLQELRQRFGEQEHELHVHQIELEIQNEELRRANLQLEQAHDRYADLFEFAPVGYILFDETGLIQQINLSGCKQLGYARQQLIGRRLSLFIESGQRVAFANTLYRVFQQYGSEHPERHRLELQMLRSDGSTWDAQMECMSLSGQPQPVARAVLTDISALKSVQREVERLNQTLEQQVEQRTAQTRQLSEELRTFVYSMTHDMTRPLRQVQGFTELLAKTLQSPDDKSARYLEHLLEATGRMNAQMAALIAFFQSSQPLNHHQSLDLNRLLDTLFQELQPETTGRSVRLTRDRLPVIEADRLSIHTVFSNLVSNAIKFTRPRPEATIHVGFQERGSDYLFSVQDNGVGFDARQSERLFGVFQRLHSERSFEGQGMGLALVRRIVNRYHGRVWADSVLDQGSVFWVQIPRDPAAMSSDSELSW